MTFAPNKETDCFLIHLVEHCQRRPYLLLRESVPLAVEIHQAQHVFQAAETGFDAPVQMIQFPDILQCNWPPDEKRTTKARPKTWDVSLTFSFVTNYLKCDNITEWEQKIS